MGKETVLFKTEEKKDVQDVAAFLRQLADKLTTGEVILQQGAEELTLTIPQIVTLEVKAEEEDKKGKTQMSIEVELEWIDGAEPESGISLG